MFPTNKKVNSPLIFTASNIGGPLLFLTWDLDSIKTKQASSVRLKAITQNI